MAREVRAGHARHEVIGDDKVEPRTIAHQGQTLFGRGCFQHLVAEIGEHVGRAQPHELLVIDGQDRPMRDSL